MMDVANLCRTCLAKNAPKNIFELKHKDSNSTWTEIMLFCLDIKVTDSTEESTKLCLKCFRRILMFYKFKLQAQKNDTMLKVTKVEAKVKHEVFLTNDDIKDEANGDDFYDCITNSVSANDKMKVDFQENVNNDCTSDDELLSVIRNIKYEYVADSYLDETKENEPDKNRRPRKKVSNAKGNSKQICEECGKSVSNLKEHMDVHKPANLRVRVSCKVCNQTFASYGARYRHTQNKHLGIRKICKICNKAVINIRQHTLVMHEKSRLQHQCPTCERRFISRSALDSHAAMHSSERPHACDQCDKRYRTRVMMLQHVRQAHNMEKPHLCQYCSKSFFKKYHLQVHLRSHTKEKPYECTDCGKFFSSSTILKNHRFLHENTKDFSCNFCDMTFARPGYLRVHMISHTKEKKHPCKYCGVKFGRSDHRKRHEYTAHEKHMIAST